MTEVWTTVGALIVISAAIKATGPVLLGGRELPRSAAAVIALLAPALLAALVLTDTFTTAEGDLTIDARAAGLACAGLGVLARAPIAITMAAAMLGAALTRAVT
jgi:Branched-chain amino acid transport protein (AzlD)